MLKLVYPINNTAGIGEFKLDATLTGATAALSIEGGMLGFLQEEAVVTSDADYNSAKPKAAVRVVVSKAINTTAAIYLPVAGFIDDSTTGTGYGTYFGSYGPASYAGSKKCTLHAYPGIYMTNIYSTEVVPATSACGIALSVDSASKLCTTPATMGTVATYIEAIRLRDLSLVSPDTLSGSDTFIVVKLK